ncbi:hypothetical protein [Actibacterium pelagium]|uniref:Uncharacterized protein n=1 Tax=Actibacterium pelagium TaxID=2029103 RepID=A0A917EHB3_9RHOB|nr:hypothetical protein [Actibacterium pelagium]GGE36312.1 hypothetical protein GCM10011517_00110 [Actibacterium pelagium]
MKRLALTALSAAITLSVAAPAQALDRKVKIINETTYDMVRFYGSNIGREDWEEDILGSDILGAGDAIIINFDDGSGYCMFDFKAVFEDGDELIRKRVNVCETGTYRYTE